MKKNFSEPLNLNICEKIIYILFFLQFIFLYIYKDHIKNLFLMQFISFLKNKILFKYNYIFFLL
jgi:hypothetical protein